MNDKLVTLFGGGGFVGRYVAQALLASGARVRIAQRDPRQTFFIRPLGGLGQTQFVAADVTRPDSVARAVAGADHVVNAVGSFRNAAAINTAGARAVAVAANEAGAHGLVHISAIGADPEASSAYGRSKGDGEVAVRSAFPSATILRPSLIFGREDDFTNRFAALIARMPVLPVLRAHTRFQPVFARDVADAVVAALADRTLAAGETFELGGPEVLSMSDIQRRLAEEVGRRPAMIEVPDAIGAAIAALGFLPGAPITSDQWKMLQRDNVADTARPGLAALGIVPTAMASVAQQWLVRYRRQGRFASRQPA